MSELFHSVDLKWYNLRQNDSFFLEGWVISPQESILAVVVRGQGTGEINSNIVWKARPDIKQARPELKVPDQPGFTLQIPRLRSWIEEAGILEVYVCTQSSETMIFSMKEKDIREIVTDCTIFYKIDLQQFSGENLIVQGWCIDQEMVEKISVQDARGKEIPCTMYRTIREDARLEYGDYVEKHHEIGFTVKVEKEKITTPKVVLHFQSRYTEKIYTIYIREMERQMTMAGRLYNVLRPGRFGENVSYIRENGVRSFTKYVKKAVYLKYLEYGKWQKEHRITREEIEMQRAHRFEINPKISVIIPLYNTPTKYLKQMLDSVCAQTYENWQLCLADGSPGDEVQKYIASRYRRDKRVVYRHLEDNLGISGNTNAALALADGDFVLLADHDDIIEQGAFFEIVKAINEDPAIDILYTDEDKITMDGKIYFEPNFKSDYNPFMMETNNYICHIFAVRTKIIREIGGFREEFDGAQDHDLILRCCEKTVPGRIHHIPKVLYHWRTHPASTSYDPESKRYAYEAGVKAVLEHLARKGIEATGEMTPNLGIYRMHRKLKEQPMVSIIIPTKDHVEDLEKCLSSVTEKTTYENYEILVVENNSTQPETLTYYEEMKVKYPKTRMLIWEAPFNYSAINNFAEKEAKGTFLLFLNNDVELISPDWLQEMLSICQQPEVAIVGAKLYYPDDTIQHAGVVLGLGGLAGHISSGISRYEPCYMGRAIMTQNVSAVTAACMMMKRSVFREVNGFDEDFQVAFNDVDLCVKTTRAGYQIVFDPYVELYHYESKSRGMEDTKDKENRFFGEVFRFEEKWPQVKKTGDPYYNPNLSLADGNCNLKE
ncbi:MAG: glycosyltransferase family 2 protein [Blautia sp.]|nr:glycosyltransferase family 2 protein [Blautia sp.]